MSSPVFLLASPRSFTSVICAMLGQHPEMYGMPELNLFIADNVQNFLQLIGHQQYLGHGIIRAVAQVFTGKQTPKSIAWSTQWLLQDGNKATQEIFEALRIALKPLSIIDKSPAHIIDPLFLERLFQAAPDAYFIHIVRNPQMQCASIVKAEQGQFLKLQNDYFAAVKNLRCDPQELWLLNQITIIDFLKKVPPDKKRTLRGEDILQNPRTHLHDLCAWMGKRTDEIAMEAMLHPENSPFAGFGPFGAPFGNDTGFLNNPILQPLPKHQVSLRYNPFQMPKGRFLSEETIRMAISLGYE